jgi:hypothetical protein
MTRRRALRAGAGPVLALSVIAALGCRESSLPTQASALPR